MKPLLLFLSVLLLAFAVLVLAVIDGLPVSEVQEEGSTTLSFEATIGSEVEETTLLFVAEARPAPVLILGPATGAFEEPMRSVPHDSERRTSAREGRATRTGILFGPL